MTRLSIFSIYDAKAAAYLQPFFSQNIETARREFTQAVNGNGQFNQFAEDYAMFLLGTFDQEEGTFSLEQSPQHVCNAVTLKQLERTDQDLMRLVTEETTPDV